MKYQKPDQKGTLFNVEPDWKKEWKGMPEYQQEDLTPWQSIYVHFASLKDRQVFEELVNQKITNETKFIWFPKKNLDIVADKRYISKDELNPYYPVYIISKGRWETRLTSKALEIIGIPYYIVVEPQEYDNYAAVINPKKILVLPFSNLGQGSIPARNWVWEHSISKGAERHWILDDNIRAFYRRNSNLKVPIKTGNTFCAIEDFVDRYKNIAIAGMNYYMFAPNKAAYPPFILNTRVYSCILIKNDIPYRWRGRYNEDTDLSLRALKDGWCTVLFNAFLALKTTTMTMKGGNTEELYLGVEDGRLKMAQSLQEQHPDCVEITQKWGRWQHSVNYRRFKNNKLILRPGVVIPDGVDNYDMELKKIK
jgi:hypothetical protein